MVVLAQVGSLLFLPSPKFSSPTQPPLSPPHRLVRRAGCLPLPGPLPHTPRAACDFVFKKQLGGCGSLLHTFALSFEAAWAPWVTLTLCRFLIFATVPTPHQVGISLHLWEQQICWGLSFGYGVRIQRPHHPWQSGRGVLCTARLLLCSPACILCLCSMS